MNNRFPTLNDALASEGLVDHWPLGINIGYAETVSIVHQGRFVSVARDERGIYERPIHYSTKMEDGVVSRLPT